MPHHVILVDENDNPVGVAEKLIAHQQGLCHRAFSVFVIRKMAEWEILLQQRAPHKYHCPNLWTNSCCSHPEPGETILAASKRRLKEELGITLDLTVIGQFHYIAHLDNGLIENEVDHVLLGYYDQQPILLNPEEAQDARWITLDDLQYELSDNPKCFTPWLVEALEWVKGAL